MCQSLPAPSYLQRVTFVNVNATFHALPLICQITECKQSEQGLRLGQKK